MALVLATTFPNLAKNSIFYWIFIKNIQNFLEISKQLLFYVQTREKVTQDLLNSFENMLK